MFGVGGCVCVYFVCFLSMDSSLDRGGFKKIRDEVCNQILRLRIVNGSDLNSVQSAINEMSFCEISVFKGLFENKNGFLFVIKKFHSKNVFKNSLVEFDHELCAIEFNGIFFID